MVATPSSYCMSDYLLARLPTAKHRLSTSLRQVIPLL